MKPLRNIRVLDLTQRLPGPMATFHMQKLGAEVIKVEVPGREDPFLQEEVKKASPLFFEWYQNLNRGKTILKTSLSTLNEKIHSKVDVVVTTLTKKKIETLGLTDISNLFIYLKSDENSSGMHDLNALARLGVLSQYVMDRDDEILDPPFLPVAGVSFSYEIALSALSHLIDKESHEKRHIDVTMIDSIKASLVPLLPSDALMQQKHLHNGSFPCYSLYRLKDGHYVALACVEEHYFLDFCEAFKLNLPVEARFDTTGAVAKKLSELFKGLTFAELVTKTSSHNYCLSLVKNPME